MEGEREEQVSLGFRCVSMAAVADKIQQNSDLSVAGNRGTGRDARVAVCGDSGTWCWTCCCHHPVFVQTSTSWSPQLTWLSAYLYFLTSSCLCHTWSQAELSLQSHSRLPMRALPANPAVFTKPPHRGLWLLVLLALCYSCTVEAEILKPWIREATKRMIYCKCLSALLSEDRLPKCLNRCLNAW